MISEQQFIEHMQNLEASFVRSLSAKVKDGWFNEVKQCGFPVFKAAMRKLMLGDKFPHFGQYWAVYNMVKTDMQGAEEVQRGCDGCRYGYIHYRVFDKTLDRKIDYTGSCRRCCPERKRTLDPNQPYHYQPGMEPWRVKKSVPIPPETAKAMIQELIEKMNRGGINWEKETR